VITISEVICSTEARTTSSQPLLNIVVPQIKKLD
jgi:hypothetical protein